ncbi:polysaccharide deacetylase family protein [Paenibacillus sp. N1-5-1-14]|uniref:polysaccharide deacetylase family protein n=1 Tax=Paenibacillus radicibacter TaxID=2972488 RepID=UPI0021599987|nr:polysaccharide deacetylase family protein [Paenibacillus radicibacter]MCR8642326.1 polysaccharide deacetylase family protein [Paenibacillus radicibacter]
MNKSLITILTLTLLLTACGNEKAQTAASPSAAPTASPVVSTPAPTASASPAPTPEATTVPKTYHMNKNYDIVPNDPSGNKKVVLLTIDDGPKEQAMIDSLIDTLDKHKAKAIFFMNGYRIKQHPELLKRIYDRGQIIGNHSWDHIELNKQTNAKIDQQIGDVQQIMKDTVGVTPQFFRAPHGAGNAYVKEVTKKHGMLYMTWSNGSKDWEMTNKKNNPEEVITNVVNQLHSGSNILMHELPWTVEAFDKLLTTLTEKGYSFVDPRVIELEMR